jgi:hypothetical protein
MQEFELKNNIATNVNYRLQAGGDRIPLAGLKTYQGIGQALYFGLTFHWGWGLELRQVSLMLPYPDFTSVTCGCPSNN